MPDPNRDRLHLVQIAEATSAIRSFIGGISRTEFLANRMACDAVTMQVYVIAETLSRLSEAARAQMGNLPWTEIRAVRNRIAHGYFSVNFEVIWDIATVDVPVVEAAARQVQQQRGDPPV